MYFIKEYTMSKQILYHNKNGDISIETSIPLEMFGKVKAFEVKITCTPAYEGSDKDLMNEVCSFLSCHTDGKVELRTLYVVHDACFVDKLRRIEKLVFQVITPLEPQWHC